MEVFDEHQGGQLRIGAAGDPLELFPLSDAAIPDVGHVVTPAENELERRAVVLEVERLRVECACGWTREGSDRRRLQRAAVRHCEACGGPVRGDV